MNRNTDPLETRLKLAKRFPRWTQPFWTWLTGIAMPGDKPIFRWSYGTHLVALLLAWLVTLSLGAFSVAWMLQAALGAA